MLCALLSYCLPGYKNASAPNRGEGMNAFAVPPFSPDSISSGLKYTLYAGGRHQLLISPERLQGEFIIRAYRFTPPTGSLESPKRLLLLFTAFKIIWQFRKIKRIKSSCFILLVSISDQLAVYGGRYAELRESGYIHSRKISYYR
jgi:hypothetical protein